MPPADCIMEAVRKRHHNYTVAAATIGLIPSFILCDHIPLDLDPLAQDFQNQKQYSYFLHLHHSLPLQFSHPFFSLSDRGQKLSSEEELLLVDTHA